MLYKAVCVFLECLDLKFTDNMYCSKQKTVEIFSVSLAIIITEMHLDFL